jgi:hypothetical protein
MILRTARRKRSTSVFFPFGVMHGFFVGQASLFVFGGIVGAMSQFVMQERREFATPHLAAIRGEFDRPHKYASMKFKWTES